MEEKEEEERKGETAMEEKGFPGPDLPCWLCHRSQLLGAMKD
jgi:hypothetical protein